MAKYKPTKSLELHYPIIQFLIIINNLVGPIEIRGSRKLNPLNPSICEEEEVNASYLRVSKKDFSN